MTNHVLLGDVCEFLDHKRRPVTEGLRTFGPYPYYGANGQQGWIDDFLFDEPLVLLAEDGGHFGSTTKPIAYKIQGKTWVNNHAHVLRPLSGCDIDFLTHVLSFFDVSRFVNGSTRPKLTKGNAEQIRIPLPPVQEQKRLAILLDQAVRLRRMRRYGLNTLFELQRGIYRHFCEEHSKDFRQYVFGDTALMQIIDGDRGTAYPKGTDFSSGGYCLFLNTSNVLKGEFDFNNCDFISIQKDKQLRKGKLQRGDVVLTTRGTLGNNALYDTSIRYEHIRINSGMVILRPNVAKLLPEYLVSIFNSDEFAHQVLVLTSGSAQQQLPISVLSKITLDVPPLTVQQELVNFTKQYQRLRATHIEALRQTDHLFQTLLHRAFS